MKSFIQSIYKKVEHLTTALATKLIQDTKRDDSSESALESLDPHGEKSSKLMPIRKTIQSFSKTEKKIFYGLLVVFIISMLGVFLYINKLFLIEIPTRGGTLTSGVIGTPRFINPLLAISDADRDLTALVYSGLLRATPQGKLIPDLAESYNISEDGLSYTFTLKDELVWHDGKPISSDDVIFTITMVKDSVLKSPKRASWEGVSVEKINDRVIRFTLEQPYSPFLENTVLGILPKHIWGDVTPEQFGFAKFNIEPIGSGAYKIKRIQKDTSGIPKFYKLEPFKHFSLGEPYISHLQIRFYANEEALLNSLSKKEIGAVNAITPQKARELRERGLRVLTYNLPRVFGVFLNQNQNTIFTNRIVRKALDVSLDRKKIVREILFAYGTELHGPLPPGSLGYMPIEMEIESAAADGNRIEQAKKILEDGGWKLNKETNIRERKTKKGTEILSFSLVTSDAEELKNAGLSIKNTWEEIGADVNLKIFNTGDLNQNIIRPRKYDALFFGEIIGRESDPFAFWHSSQMNDPGLNIAMYANITTDELLEEGRQISDRDERIRIYKQFQKEIAEDIPAIFVYAPDFIYILPHNINGVETGTISIPSERFLDIYKWYIRTDKIWKIFAN